MLVPLLSATYFSASISLLKCIAPCLPRSEGSVEKSASPYRTNVLCLALNRNGYSFLVIFIIMFSSYRLFLPDTFLTLDGPNTLLFMRFRRCCSLLTFFQSDVFFLMHLTFKRSFIGSVVYLFQQSCLIVYLIADFLSSSIISFSLTFILSGSWVLAGSSLIEETGVTLYLLTAHPFSRRVFFLRTILYLLQMQIPQRTFYKFI